VKDVQPAADQGRSTRRGGGRRTRAAPDPEDLLRCDGAAAAWAVFDPDWYLCTYPEVRDHLADRSRCGVLQFYLAHGQRLGHSPNMFFDESWYRASNPNIAVLLEQEKIRSGFDHYCRIGYRDRSPHWLFDDMLYRRLNPDIGDALPGLFNRYDHYLRHGAREDRPAHILFDPHYYRTHAEDDGEIGRLGPFIHFLHRIHWVGADANTAIYFDADWYRYTYPAVDAAVRAGRWLCALHHYTCNDTPDAFDPLCQFSERFYRERNPDIQAALAAGTLRSGYQHFLFHGVFELRPPAPSIELVAVPQHDSAAQPRNAFACLLHERHQRIAPPLPDERQTQALFAARAHQLLPRHGRSRLDFTPDGPPDVSVIVVARDNFALTMQALASLRANYGGAIELILVDSGSSDETAHITRYVTGARHLRFANNIGFVRGCNAAQAHATAPAVLFMNNDVELAPGAVAAALRRLASDPAIGAVGGKVIRTHGRLQEAGCIVWRDGSTSGYLREADAAAPEAEFVRDVDFCSGVFLLLRRDALAALGGFDAAFAPAYYEDVDLCVRLWQAGYRVVYDPAAQLTHYEYASARCADAALALMATHREVFVRRHRGWLRQCHARGPSSELLARTAGPPGHRVLFIEDTVPLRGIGSGYGRANDIIRAMVALGAQVTVFPVNGCRFDPAQVFAELPDTVEVMHDRTLANLPGFLRERAGCYDTIWISRAHNLDKALLALHAAYTDPNHATVVLDTEAVFALRDLARATLTGAAFDLDRALQAEFANAWFCQHVVAVTEAEAAILRGRVGLPAVTVLGTARDPAPTPRDYGDRSGLLFVGAMHRADSPNYDALGWFIEAVLPRLAARLGAAARLTVAGYAGPGIGLRRWRGHPQVALAGKIADLTALYDAHRVFVAPTRFAAGTPYKIYEAAAHGLPVVATGLLRDQLGWRDGIELLAADPGDPDGFAELIATLYHSRRLWQALRNQALARLARDHNQAGYRARIGQILGRPTPEIAEPAPRRYPAAA
jgi:GT2 family glycosyltransferase